MGEVEEQLRGYGKLRNEKDILSREVEHLTKLLHEQNLTRPNEKDQDSEKVEKIHQSSVESSPMMQNSRNDDLELNEKFSDLNRQLDDLQNRNAELSKDISELRGTIDKQHEIINEQETNLKRFGEMAVEIDLKSKEIEHLKKLIREQNDQKVNAEEVEKTRKECARLKDDNLDWKRSNEHLNALMIEKDGEISKLKSDLNQTSDNITLLQTNLSEQKTIVTRQQSMNEELEARLREVEDQLRGYGKLQTDNDILTRELNILRSQQVNKPRDNSMTLSSEINEVKSEEQEFS